MAESSDLTNEYLASREEKMLASGADEMIEWVMRQRGGVATRAVRGTGRIEERPLDPFPTDRQPPAEPSTFGTVARSVAEIPRQIVGGIDDAARNALGILNPLTDWLNANVADLTYDPVAKPKTGTGAVTRSVSEFLTGFVPALKGLRAVGATGKVLAPMTAGAIADFSVRDPHEARLSNVWKEAGLPDNLLTDYLASDPSDSAIEGRFKNALEGAGLGTATEGILLGARALRASKGVKALGDQERQALQAKYGELPDDAFKVIGDPSKPMIETAVRKPSAAVGKVQEGMASTVTTAADDLVGGRALIDAGESQVYVNFARIDGPDEVKALIGEMANRFKGSIDEATRGTISHAETSSLADDLGMTVADLLERRRGQPLNAEEALAARRLWTASGEKLLETAKLAASPNAGPVDQFNFRKMMATHYAIQAEVIGARTETARALASWRIPAGGGIEKARAIEQVMQAMGGPEASAEMARRLAILAESGATPAALGKFAQKGYGAASVDAIREVWVNGLLSSPATHIVNSTSNLAVAFQQIFERGLAARIGEIRGTEGGVAAGEAVAMAHGMISSVKDAFRLAGKALKTGESGFALNQVDTPRTHALSADAFRISSETGLGRTVDFIGEFSRLPSRFLGAEDEFFKTIGYRMELHAQALRQATSEGLKGPDLYKRMGQLLIDSPENIRIAAADAALYSTFTNAPGQIGRALLKAREAAVIGGVPVGALVLPFLRTPVNIARYTFERTPFAPLVGQWRDDIAAGGARADLALARMATGTSIMLVAFDWADSGLISGMGPMGAGKQGEREAMIRQGWQPYSVKVGDRWYSYSRTDPFGMTMGMAADIAEAVRRGEMNEDDADEWEEVAAMAITATAQAAVTRRYLQGFSEFVNVMGDPQRYAPSYIKKLFASFVPATSLMGAVERAVDPTMRDAQTIGEAMQAKIAGLSDKLPARRNLWGEEMRAQSGIGTAYDFFSPVQSRKVDPSPIDTELMRLANSSTAGESALPQRIRKRASFGGVQINFKEWPHVYDEYVRLSGGELQHQAWRMGAKDYLNAVVSGKHPMSKVYNLGSDERKLNFISTTLAEYRRQAQQAILADPRFEDFAAYVQVLQMDQQQLRMPVLR